MLLCCFFLFFFFQAEDGIRDLTVTGVQTCALPIWSPIRAFGLYDHTHPSPVTASHARMASSTEQLLFRPPPRLYTVPGITGASYTASTADATSRACRLSRTCSPPYPCTKYGVPSFTHFIKYARNPCCSAP